MLRASLIKVETGWVMLALLLLAGVGRAQEVWLLWPNGAPGPAGQLAPEVVRITPEGDHVVSHVSEPSVTPFLPSAAARTGVAVIIAPGGGHRELWMDHEGYDVARVLAAHGIAAFVLKYRLAREPGSPYTVEGTELGDMQRAIRLVRSRAAGVGVDPRRIGVMGFSAGGELAALAAVRGDVGSAGSGAAAGVLSRGDPIDRQSAQVAFQALIYPAIPKDMALSARTPPAFLACGEKDRQDIAEGLPELYLAMHKAGVSAEIVVFAGVGHGFGVRASNTGGVKGWPELFVRWLSSEGLIAGDR